MQPSKAGIALLERSAFSRGLTINSSFGLALNSVEVMDLVHGIDPVDYAYTPLERISLESPHLP